MSGGDGMPRTLGGENMKVADMHCDTIYEILRKKEQGQAISLRSNEGHVDLLRMKRGQYLIQNFALFVELGRDGDPWERVCALFRCYQEEMEQNRDMIAPVLRFTDIAENEAAGKMSAMLTVEEGAVCGGDLDKLHALYRMGVRMITLTWNYENEIGFPNFLPKLRQEMKTAREHWKSCEPGNPEEEEKRQAAQAAFDAYFHTPNRTAGLTEKGKELVAEMERLGMIPDVSHLSDGGFYDVLEVTSKPFVASHSNARAVSPSVRNLTDDMIRRLSERGGVTGLNFCADFLEERPIGQENPGTIEAVVRHAKHIVSVGGIEVLGLGSDFDGIGTHGELPGAESMGRLWEALHGAGFTEGALDKVFCENVLRVYRDTL